MTPHGVTRSWVMGSPIRAAGNMRTPPLLLHQGSALEGLAVQLELRRRDGKRGHEDALVGWVPVAVEDHLGSGVELALADGHPGPGFRVGELEANLGHLLLAA